MKENNEGRKKSRSENRMDGKKIKLKKGIKKRENNRNKEKGKKLI